MIPADQVLQQAEVLRQRGQGIGTPLLPTQIVAERSHLSIPSLPNWVEPISRELRPTIRIEGKVET